QAQAAFGVGQEWQQAEYGPLQGHHVDDQADAAQAQGEEVERQDRQQQWVEQGDHRAHLTSRMMPNADSSDAVTSRGGTRTSRSRASTDSTTPTPTASRSSAATNTPQSAQALPVVNGTTSRTSRAPNRNSFRGAP